MGKSVDSNSHRLLPLYYKRTDQPNVLVTPENRTKENKRALINLQTSTKLLKKIKKSIWETTSQKRTKGPIETE